MELALKKPIIFFDLETTGTNILTDRIVEISYIKILPSGAEIERTIRVNPERHIPAEATAIHHITDDDVKNEPTFKQVAQEIANVFTGADIAGFNSNRFDIPVLAEEFIRAGVSIDLARHKFIDVQTIFHKMEQRTLIAAYKFYCGKDLEEAHSANADTRFRDGDDMYLYFLGSTDGYLTVWLEDESRTVYNLLPYPRDPKSEVRVKRYQEYTFFNSSLGKGMFGPEEELILTAPEETEYNRIYVVFSPNPYSRPAMSADAGLPSLPSADFSKWLMRMRRNDPKMGVKAINLEISPRR